MYRDPVACICLSADDAYMIIASGLRASLEYQISRLRLLFAYNIGIQPLLRCSVSTACCMD